MRNQCVCIWVYTCRVRKKECDGGWCLYNVKTCCTNCIQLMQQYDTQLYTIIQLCVILLHQLYTIIHQLYTIVCHIVASQLCVILLHQLYTIDATCLPKFTLYRYHPPSHFFLRTLYMYTHIHKTCCIKCIQ